MQASRTLVIKQYYSWSYDHAHLLTQLTLIQCPLWYRLCSPLFLGTLSGKLWRCWTGKCGWKKSHPLRGALIRIFYRFSKTTVKEKRYCDKLRHSVSPIYTAMNVHLGTHPVHKFHENKLPYNLQKLYSLILSYR